MTKTEKNIKRVFDVFFACVGLVLIGWFILLMILISKIVIGGNGIFKQKRVGQHAKLFTIYKIETIHPEEAKKETPHISRLGTYIRKYKIDEFPQLWNVLQGTMSFVGPRPDIVGFADQLEGEAKIILTVKPGITGPATVHFRNEEAILKAQENPEIYNKEVIWPQKVARNIRYVKEYRFMKDIHYIFKTFFS
ncbi:sugar transferase [Kordia jejudonensis]|uniref:sugar transferase n=1 Tax=Kordia jejudonensis TaxID=1348245 RepID=UPI000628FC5B|nr:sugar transferase [Kordia jejudonensis]